MDLSNAKDPLHFSPRLDHCVLPIVCNKILPHLLPKFSLYLAKPIIGLEFVIILAAATADAALRSHYLDQPRARIPPFPPGSSAAAASPTV